MAETMKRLIRQLLAGNSIHLDNRQQLSAVSAKIKALHGNYFYVCTCDNRHLDCLVVWLSFNGE